MNDWGRYIGKPRRISMDNVSPGMTGPAWGRISHVYGWQLISAPPRTPHQNGLVERSMRSLNVPIQAIMTDETMTHGQDVLTMATIARNHTPRTIAGVPPALAMTGRSDMLVGCAAAIWDHDPESAGEVIAKQQNDMRNISEARNAAITASAQQALKTVLQRNIPDRAATFFPI